MKKKKATKSPKNIDEYIIQYPKPVQALLKKIRAMIRKAAPKAEESISYGVPAYKLNGKPLIYFAAYKDHISIYPIPSGPAAFKKAIAQYITGKGTMRFLLGKSLPMKIVRLIVKYHLLRVAARALGYGKKKK